MPEQPFVAPAGLVAAAVTGADRASYLEAVLAQHVTDAESGSVRGALELDVHGAPLAVLDVVTLADRLVLLVPEVIAADVLARLGGRTFLADARFERCDDDVVALRGDGAHGLVGAAGLTVEPGQAAMHDDVLVVGRDGGVDLTGPRAALDVVCARLRQLGAVDADAAHLEAWRVHAGVPAWEREITSPHLPEELGLLATHVHLDKGCYPGQEAVARMWALGRPRRRLALVSADAGVDVGWESGSGRQRVRVTSVADLDGTRRGLAFVPGDAAPGARFADGDDGGVGVEVLRLLGADVAVPGHDPSVPRRRDRR